MTYYPVVHPFLTSSDEKNLTNMVRGKGIYCYDKEGNEYLDAIGGLWNVVLGYGNEELIKEIELQARKLPFINMWSNTNDCLVRLAHKLMEIAGNGFSKVMYTCTGSESVELCIKLMRKYQSIKGKYNKKYIIVFESSYHGTTYGALTATGLDKEVYGPYSPMLQGFAYLSVPNEHNLEEQVRNLERLFETSADKIAGVIIEPILAAAGVLEIPESYLKRLKELCLANDAIVALDEITTGLYRTGQAFAFQYYDDLIPDLICTSKALTSGYMPFGAVIIGDKIMDSISDVDSIVHFSTQNGNLIAAATAVKTLEILERENYSRLVRDKGNLARKIFEDELSGLPIISAIRMKGLLIGIELNDQKPLDFQIIWSFMNSLKNSGLLVYPFRSKLSSGIVLAPPYIITEDEIRMCASKIKKVLTRINLLGGE